MPEGKSDGGYPRVSVLIAAYNTRGWIVEAVDSVLRQEGCQVEVIVIDDASTDGTGALISDHYHDDPRVRLLTRETNRGPSAARNTGLKAATGDWVAVLDADDWFYPRRLRTLVDGAKLHGFDMVGDEQALYDDSAKSAWGLRLHRSGTLPRRGGPWHDLSLDNVLDDMTLGVLQLVVRREELVRYGVVWDEDVRYGEDYLFLVDCMLAGLRLGVLDRPLYGVRIRDTSLTADRLFSQRQLRALLDRIAAKPDIDRSPAMKNRLVKARSRIDESLRYMAVVDRVKGRGVLAGLIILLWNPGVWAGLFRRTPGMVRDRYRRYVRR